jgi:fimbrial isopeptide formation D2 family protein/uncharacterized repeat protein (TIGR01451 family)
MNPNLDGSFFESLEERVLFDGVPDAPMPAESVDSFSVIPAQVQQVHQQQALVKELLVVDSGVANNEALLSEVLSKNRSFEVVILNENDDGISQIAKALEQSELTYSAIHIVSHGDPGEVHLGNRTLSESNLHEYANALASWSGSLTADADLLFYGCELAGNESGESLMQSISALTGADVAASDDLTGDAKQDGDWDLEFTVGTLQTTVISAKSWQGVLAGSPVPTATLDVPPEEFINEDFQFTVFFDNTGANPSDVGYSPFIDLSVPDGVDINGVTFLGSPVTLINAGMFNGSGNLVDGGGNAVTHPITGLPVTGTPGETLYVIEVPFGSFVPDQPNAEFTVDATLDSSDGAVVGSPLDIDATGGFALGCDPLDNPGTDPPIIGSTDTDTVTPSVIDLIKRFDAEDGIESATGENYPIVYTLVVDIADGETITNLDLEDYLPNSFVYVGGSINVDTSNATAASGQSITDVPVSGSPQNAPDNNFLIEFGSVTGSSSDEDIVVKYTIWVDSTDANGNPIIDPLSGNDTNAMNDSSVVGTYGGTNVGDDGPETDILLEQNSLVTQKYVAIVNDAGGAGATPGDTLEYTIEVQISDFFEYSDVFLDDVLGDGQDFDTTFAPTLVINEGGVVTSGAFAAANFSVTPGSAGVEDIFFDIAAEVPDGVLTGDLFADATMDGATSVTVTFRAVIQDVFDSDFPSGDPSVDIGDILTNDVTVTGTLPSGQTEEDTGATSIEILGPSVTKEVYAIDGVLFSPGDEIVAGITTTYRITLELPTSDVENLVLTDYLPLPIYNALEVTSFNAGIAGATPPPAGVATYGPSHTLDTVVPATAGGPIITTDGVANTIEFDFGSFDIAPSQPSTIDILFTVTGQDVLMADGLTLNNQVLAEYGSTNQGTSSSAALAPVVVAAPVLNLTKGVVATDAVSPTFSPATVGPVAFNAPGSASSFAGGINSTNLAASPIDSNLSDADAGDLVTFAIVIENTGGANAFDLLIQDTVPPEYLVPGAGLNLQVRDGDGNLLAYTGADTDLFGIGIEIDDPTPTTGSINDFDEAQTSGDGSNIIVITYDLELAVAVGPNQTYTNTAELAEYGALDNGRDHTDGSTNDDWIDDATVATLNFESTKSVVATSEVHTGFVGGFEQVTIGEIVRYRLVSEIPEGTVDSLVFRDLLPTGLQFLNDGTSTMAFVSNGGGITSTAFGGLGVNVGAGAFVNGNETTVGAITPGYVLGDNNIGSTSSTNSNTDNFNSGSDIFFKFGTIANADNDADSEFVVVEFNALVLNISSNNNNVRRANRFRVQDGNSNFGDSNTVQVRITEPLINNVNKIATPTTGDAGDIVTFTVTFSNSNSAIRSDAFDVNVIDNLPPEFALVGGSVVITPAGGATGITDNTVGNSIAIDIDQIPIGGSIAIEYQATLLTSVEPGEVICNKADITYTSLPGAGTAANPTGSVTPGASGADNGERDGTGAHNDYADSDTAKVTIFAPTVDKSLISTSIVNGSNTNNQAVVGELVTYEVSITVPEGTINSAELIDTLDAGLTFVSLDSITTSAGVTSSTVNLNDASTITPSVSGQDVTFGLGDITNTNSSNSSAETITIRYTVRVDNVVTNQSGTPLDNVVKLAWMLAGTTPMMSNTDDAEDIQVIEPDLVVNKGVSAASADANDSVTFTITIGHSGTSDTDAFDVTFSDPVPPEINWNMSGVTINHSVLGDISALFQRTGNTLETTPGSSFDLLFGQTVSIQITGTIDQSVTPGQTLANTATADWSSLDGNDPNERDGDDGEGGALDDYEDDSTASLTIIGSPSLAKDIVGTSIDDANNDDTEVVIGELVQYKLTVTLPESTIPGANFLDNLDLGLEFVSLDSVTTFSGGTTNPTNIASDIGAFTNTSLFNPTVTGNGTTAAQSLEFDFGTITNTDNDNTTIESLEIVYTVRVSNIPSNTSNGSASGQMLDNSATFNWEDSSGAPFGTDPADAPDVEVIEPELNITKVINDDTPYLGQVVNYTINISHSANSDADAHNLQFADLLPTGMTLNLSSVNVVGAGVVSNSSSGNQIDLELDELDLGNMITITYSATVTTDATQIGNNLNNTASTTWSSLPDGDPSGTTERDGDGGNGGEDDYSDDVMETAILTHPQVELEKETVGSAPSASGIDGNFDITYDFTITSTGNDPLTQVSLIENLAAQFGSTFVGIVLQGGQPATITASTAIDALELNAGFNGSSNTELIDNTGGNTNSIAQNEFVTIRIIVEVDPNAVGAILDNGDLVNQAEVTATGDDSSVAISDLSDDPDDMTDDDPNTDDNPDDPNHIRFPNISLVKSVAGIPVPADSGTAGNFDVTYEFTITNTGSTSLDTLILNENLAAHFGGAFVRIVPQSGVPATITGFVASDLPGINGAYDGTAANQNIFDGSSSLLLVNEFVTVQIVVEMDPDNTTAIFDGVSSDGSGDFENQATVTATDSGDPGSMVSDNSDDPADLSDNSDDTDNDPDDPTGLILSDITLTKTQFGPVVSASSGVSGNFDVTYDLAITNTGGQALNSLSLIEDLQAQYVGAFVRIVPQSGAPATVVVASSNASDNPEINSAYDGTTANSQIIDNTGLNTNLLDIGETITIRIIIEVDPDNATANLINGALVNQAATEGTGTINGDMPNDESDDPNDVTDDDPDMDNNPDDPNVLSIAEIELEKAVTGTPTIAASGVFGNFDVTYTFEVTNTGTETLSNLSLTDDLATQLGGAFVQVVSLGISPGATPPTNAPALNDTGASAYDGTSGSDMLAGALSDELRPGESFFVTLVIEVDPDSPTANYVGAGVLENSATTTGDGENGGMPSDVSDDPNDTDEFQDPSDPGNDPDDPTALYIPSIGLAKAAGDAVANGDNWDVTFTLVVENNGTVDLNNLSLFDNVASQFGNAFVASSGLAVQNFVGTGTAPGANGAWNGNNALDMLDGMGQLDIGDSFEVAFTITIDPDGIDSVSQALENQANITGDALDEDGNPLGTQATDNSDNGTDPDSENDEDDMDGTPGNDPTPIIIADIGVAKSVVGNPTLLANGNFEAIYEVVIENIGTVDLANLTLDDDIATQFGVQFVDAYGLTIATAPPASSMISLDSVNWDGSGATEMVDTSSPSLLAVGDSFVLQFKVEIDPDAGGTASAPLENQVTATGDAVDDNGDPIVDSMGTPITATDLSDSGTDTSTDLGDHGTSDDPTPVYIPAIGLAKQAGDAVANGDNWDIEFTFVVENTGTVDLTNLNLLDDISTEFGNAFVSASGLTVQNFVGSGTTPGANGTWQSNTTLNMLDGMGQLNVGDSFEVVFTITIDPDGIDSISQGLENQGDITGDALDESGNPLDDGMGGTLQATDESDNGTDPNGENGEDDGDGTFGNDPTPIIIADIGVAKEVFGPPVHLANDNWEVTYQLVIENIGTVDLANLSLLDDINAQFGPAFVSAGNLTLVTPPANAGSNVVLDSANWDGDTVIEMIDQTAMTSLAVGDFYVVQFTVEVDPDATGTSGPLDNQVTTGGDAVDSNGDPITDSSEDPITAEDDSDSGSDPSDTNSGGDGDSGGSDDPTPLLLPDLSVGKQANTVTVALDGSGAEITGSFDVQYLVVIENTGTIELTDLQLLDDLTTASTFGDAYDPSLLSGPGDLSGFITGPSIVSHTLANSGDLPNLNAGFLGGAGQTNLFDGISGALQVGEQIVVAFTIRVDADEMRDGDPTDGMAQNQVQGSAESDEGPANDDSDDGLNPNTDNGDGGTDDPTPFEVPQIRIYKGHSDAVSNGNGTSTITVTLRIENSGTVDLGNLSLSENLTTQFGSAFVSATTPTISIPPTNAGSNIPATLINTGWAGNTAFDVFDNAETGEILVAGDDFTITFDVVVDPDLLDDDSDYLTNTATISGEGTNFDGTTISVDDQSGADDGTGIDSDEPTEAIVPEIAIVKSAGDAVANGDNWDLTFTMIVENTGSVNLNNLTLFDDIVSQFGNAYVGVTGLAVQNFAGSGSAPTVNPGWLTVNTQTLITGGDLDPGDRFEVVYTVTIDPDGIDSVSQALNNQATVNGAAVDKNGDPLLDEDGDQFEADDTSDDGTNPQGTNPGENGDDGTDADPTPIIIADVSIAKEVIGQPTILSNGNFGVTYQLVVENIGTVHLSDMTLVDDIQTQFGAAVFQGVSGLTMVTGPTDSFSSIAIDPTNWDGTGVTDILDQGMTNSLAIGDQFTISFVVEIDAVAATGVLENQATVGGTGVDESGTPYTDSSGEDITASDDSDSGSETGDDNVGEPNDSGGSDDPTPTYIPHVGLAKTAGDAVANGDNWDVEFTLYWENTGNVDLTNLTMFDDIATQFGNAFSSISGLSLQNYSGTGTAPIINSGWMTNTTQTMISGGTAHVGDSFEVVFTVTIDPDGIDDVSQGLENQATTSGEGLDENGDPLLDDSGDPVTANDVSDNGTGTADENGEDDGDGTFGDDPTPIIIADVSVVKSTVGIPVELNNGNFEVTYQLIIENIGAVDLADLTLTENLSAHFGSVFENAGNLALATGPADATSNIILDSNWNGSSQTEMIDQSAATLLAVGDSFVVTFTVEVDPDAVGAPATLENQVNVGGNAVDSNGDPINDSSGDPITATDESDDGTDPNGDNPDEQGDHGTTDDPTPLLIPDIAIGKVAGDARQNGDDWVVHFRLFVENTGTVSLDNLTLLDDIAAQFGNAFVSVDNLAIVNFVGTGTAPGANGLWAGNTALDILDGTGTLDVGDRFQVVFRVTIDPDGIDSVSQGLDNQATVSGEGINPDGTPMMDDSGDPITTTDVSDNGTDVHGENGEDGGDGVANNDPTPIIIADISLAKSVAGTPIALGNGNFEVTYNLVVENTGTVGLSNLSLTEDIATQFGDSFVGAYGLSMYTLPSSSSITLAPWDGDGLNEMINQSALNYLDIGDSFVLQFTVEIDPDAGGTATAPLENQVTATANAVDENGDPIIDSSGDPITTTDDSDSGTDPSTDNDSDLGDHGTSDDPTPVYIPSISLAKQAGDAVANGDNWNVTFTFVVENTGTVDLTNLELLDNIAAEFGNAFVSANGLTIQKFVGSGTAPGANAGWQGNTTLNMLDGSGQLNVGDSFEVVFTVTIDPDGIDSVSQALENQGTVIGDALDENGDPLLDSTGNPIDATDESDNGTNPNGENGEDNGDGTFGNDPTPLYIADLSVAKATVGEPVLTPLGNYVVTYQLQIENTGTVDLTNLSLLEDLATQFGTAFVDAGNLTLLSGPSNSGSSISLDSAAWNGNSVFEMMDSGAVNILQTGDSFTISFEVEIDPKEATFLENQVQGSGEGIDENGDPLEDVNGDPLVANDDSDSGTETGSSNPDGEGDSGTSDDPTPVDLPEVPLSEISGTVFEDTNNDGVQDPGEPGISGVQVTLTGTDVFGNPVSITVTTDANGDYLFDSLNAGTYELTQTQPTGFVDGQDNGNPAWTIGDDVMSDIVIGWGESFGSNTFGEIRENVASGNPPQLPILPPISGSPIGNLLSSYQSGPGPVYSGTPYNPLSLDSGRPITGGYSGVVEASDCGCPEPINPCCEPVDPCSEIPNQEQMSPEEIDRTLLEAPTEFSSGEESCNPEGPPSETSISAPLCSFDNAQLEPVKKPSFLCRFREWLSR